MLKVTGFTFFVSLSVFGQSDVSASGGFAQANTGSSSYTVGQSHYETYSGTGGFVSQGVQHQYEISELDTVELAQFSVSIYPNPVQDYLTVRTDISTNEKYGYELYNNSGSLIVLGEMRVKETLIGMGQLPTATYLLKVFSGKKVAKTFKIIKR